MSEVAAVVCLAPFVPGRETQRSAGTPLARLALAALADRLRIALRREPRGVAIGGEPGETAILVREDAAARERALVPDGIPWENRVVLRPRLRTPHPLRVAPRVDAPLLVAAGEEDGSARRARPLSSPSAPPGASWRCCPAATSTSTTGRASTAEVGFLGARLGG